MGSHFIDYDFNSTQATQFYQKALQLSRLCADKKEECSVLIGISQLKCKVGDYCAGQMYASEGTKAIKTIRKFVSRNRGTLDSRQVLHVSRGLPRQCDPI